MEGAEVRHQPRKWTLVLVGGVVGEFFGLISGPIAFVAFVMSDRYLYGMNSPGIAVLFSPILRALLGAVQGVVVGAVWPFSFMRRRNLTILRLMLLVTIAGPTLAIALWYPPLAVLLLVNALLLLPVLILALTVVARRRQRRSRSARGVSAENTHS